MPEDVTVDLQRSLGRLEGKMDLLLSNLQVHLTEDTARFRLVDDKFIKLESRQNAVERKAWIMFGGVAVIWAIIQLWFSDVLKGFTH